MRAGAVTKTFTLTYDEAPASLNKGGTGSRRHWSVGAREKKRWEGIYAYLLLDAKVPRGMTRARASAVLEFKAPARRDSENFRSALSKPFADALVKGGWLADDTDDFFELTKVVCSKVWLLPRNPQVKGRLTITLEADYDLPAENDLPAVIQRPRLGL